VSFSPRTPHSLAALILIAGCLLLVGCQTPAFIKPEGSKKIYSSQPVAVETGTASWYGGRWIGRLTANGEHYRKDDMTAAHKKLPFNTMVRVVNLKNNKSTVVRINNRGPYVKGRIIDLSVCAAKEIGTYEAGVSKVRLEILKEIPILTKPNLRLPATDKLKPTPAKSAPPAKPSSATQSASTVKPSSASTPSTPKTPSPKPKTKHHHKKLKTGQ